MRIANTGESPSAVPDLPGLSARHALQELSRIGMTAELSGDGVVVEQTPEPGAAPEPGETCRLRLKRVSPAIAEAGGQP